MSQFTSAWYAAMRTKREASAPQVAISEPPRQSESALHDQIKAHCRFMGWVYVHSRMDRATTTAKGVCDFIIFASGKVLCVECKTPIGKLSPDQNAWIAAMGRQKFTVHVVRSMREFVEVIQKEGL